MPDQNPRRQVEKMERCCGGASDGTVHDVTASRHRHGARTYILISIANVNASSHTCTCMYIDVQ